MHHPRGVGQGAGGVDHVVEDDDVLALDLADEVHDHRLVGPRPPLVDDGQAGTSRRLAKARAILIEPTSGATTAMLSRGWSSKCFNRTGRRVEVVQGDVEEALDLRRVQIDGQDPVGARRR